MLERPRFLLEIGEFGHPFTVPVQDHRTAIEDQVGLRSDIADVIKRDPVALGVLLQDLPADEGALLIEGRGSDIDHQGGVLSDQAFHRSFFPVSQFLVNVPKVFANGESDALFPKRDDPMIEGRLEVTSFIEDVVIGQEGFVVDRSDLAVHQKISGVVAFFSRVSFEERGSSKDGRYPVTLGCQIIDRILTALDEGVELEEVLGRISAKR
jgi:hypothetical protein